MVIVVIALFLLVHGDEDPGCGGGDVGADGAVLGRLDGRYLAARKVGSRWASGEPMQCRQQGGGVGSGSKERGVGRFHGGDGQLSQLGAAVGDAQLLCAGVGGIDLTPDEVLGLESAQHL
jgi:hypothetical protein